MYNFPVYWNDKLKIDFLQRVILIHSYIYYELNNSIWNDSHYDEVSKQLTIMQNNYSKGWIKKKTQYGYAFMDFDGTTGFDLWERLTKRDKRCIMGISNMILKGEGQC